jgi:drug/metabolite transporter (DMT)-like permease
MQGPRGAFRENTERPVTPPLRTLLPLGAFLLCSLIWGSTWLAIKLGYESIPPLTGAALRFGIASVLLFAIVRIARLRLPRGRQEWGLTAFFAVFLFGGDYGLIYWSEQHLTSGLTSVLFATMPLFTSLLAAVYGLERLTPRKLAGIALAIAGTAVLFSNQLDLRGAQAAPMAGVLAGSLCAAATSVAAKRHGTALHPASLNAPAMALGALILGASAAARGEELRFPDRASGWAIVLYLALAGTVVAFLLYFWLLQQWEATHTSFVSFLTPVLAVALGAVFLGEPVGARLLAGSLLVLAGVYLGSGARLRPGFRAGPGASTRAEPWGDDARSGAP